MYSSLAMKDNRLVHLQLGPFAKFARNANTANNPYLLMKKFLIFIVFIRNFSILSQTCEID